MQDTIYTLAQNRLLWIAVAFAVGLGLIAISEPSRRFYRRTPSLLRSHYWKAMLAFGLLLGGAAIVLYLAEIAHSVTGLVDRLEAAIGDEVTKTEDLRNLATATALLLGALAASATLVFQLVRVWITERTTTATEEGLITDRINKAVEALGTEKTVTFQARKVNWTETAPRLTSISPPAPCLTCSPPCVRRTPTLPNPRSNHCCGPRRSRWPTRLK